MQNLFYLETGDMFIDKLLKLLMSISRCRGCFQKCNMPLSAKLPAVLHFPRFFNYKSAGAPHTSYFE